MNKIALRLEYEGTEYHGWQNQTQLLTIQSCVENALSRVANEPISVVCAGRTDKGVHALGQIIHFVTTASRTLDNWIRGGNTNLPNNITIRGGKMVDETFHARYSATARCYTYVIYNHPIRSSIFERKATWHYKHLDEQNMHTAGAYLLGEHDFSSFRGIDCQAKTPIRTIQTLNVSRRQNFIILDIKANAFLHHMVRNIAGVLMIIGEGKKPPQWAKEVLVAQDRKAASITAPPNGLYLMEVEYPEQFGIPNNEVDRWW